MNTVNIKINGYDYTMKRGITILDASFETLKFQREYLQQPIPTLYYLKGVVDVDDSGVCVVEVDGELVNASTTRIREGMEIKTRSEAVMAARKEALAKILAIHNKSCLYCMRSGQCELPMMTSCCPGWIKYAEHFYPDMLDNLSTCKSPHAMFGALIKSWYAEK